MNRIKNIYLSLKFSHLVLLLFSTFVSFSAGSAVSNLVEQRPGRRCYVTCSNSKYKNFLDGRSHIKNLLYVSPRKIYSLFSTIFRVLKKWKLKYATISNGCMTAHIILGPNLCRAATFSRIGVCK